MENIIDRLNEYSAQHQSHGGICAETADYIKELEKRAEAAEARAEKFVCCPICTALMDGHTTPAKRMAARLKARCNHDH